VNLILLEPDEIRADRVTLRDARAAHVRTVLRADRGRAVRVGVIDGPLGSGVVATVDDDQVTLDCAFDAAPPPRSPVSLLLAVPRPKVLRRLWAQLAALGVDRVMLTNAWRVERPYFDTHFLAPEVYRALLIEGLQQARDSRLPVVTVHRQFKVLVEGELDVLASQTVRLLADPGPQPGVREALASHRANSPRVLIAVGPEGGWNDFERGLLRSHGFVPVSLGPRPLRTDTACVALLALVHDALRA
jgi:RsmE family RNA methyltransferase